MPIHRIDRTEDTSAVNLSFPHIAEAWADNLVRPHGIAG